MGTKWTDGKRVYAVELERGGRVLKIFARPSGGGPRRATEVPLLDAARRSFKEAQGILDGYARKIAGWNEVSVPEDERTCRVCGCTEFEPCLTAAGPCHWVEQDLCSACAEGGR